MNWHLQLSSFIPVLLPFGSSVRFDRAVSFPALSVCAERCSCRCSPGCYRLWEGLSVAVALVATR